eukprot:TRINITY_DN541_c0_g1_i1.p1 TRINITY_DN541_c0_g1~~TRINITY_DN541_c0_g1_i1.p1  ORF type:complete len:200 (-),score=59.52 TRINITY_DN541_c0_g1_i1:104-703(-)
MASAHLRAIFNEIDLNKDGVIDAHELSQAMKRAGYSFSDRVLKKLVRTAGHKDTLSFEAFIDMTDYLSAQKQSFQREDVDKDGKITQKELGQAFFDNGFNLKTDQIKLLFNTVDEDNSGTIEFEEYVDLSFYIRFLRTIFNKNDQSKSGQIKVSELTQILEDNGVAVSPDQIKQVVKDVTHLDFNAFVEIFHSLETLSK